MESIVKVDQEALQRLVIRGDLSLLSPDQKHAYYVALCEATGIDWHTRPFDYLKLNGKEVLYANKNCAEQLRQRHKISISLPEKKIEDDVFIVTARAEANGRHDEATGCVSLANLKGENRANAMMKCETKAKRRVTLSFASLGMLDETEVETIPHAEKITEKDVTPESDSALKGKPETLAAQEAWEKEKARLKAIPEDVADFFRWKKSTKKQIFDILEANHDDFEAVRGYMRDNGWMGSTATSDAAQERIPESVT